MSLPTIFEEFLREKPYVSNISSNTVEFYRLSFNSFNLSALPLTQGDINNAVVTLRESGRSIPAVNAYLRGMKVFVKKNRCALSPMLTFAQETDMGTAPRVKPHHLAAKLLAIRLKLGASQSQMGKLLEFDKSLARISEYEHGNRGPSLLVLLRYSKLARVSINVSVDDDAEINFPKNWKRPKQLRGQARG